MRFGFQIAVVNVAVAAQGLLAAPSDAVSDRTKPIPSTQFCIEREQVAGGAEVLTVFGKIQDLKSPEQTATVPLISVLRDTLGDDDPANDRLRYVWVLTASRPTVLQRFAAATPFFYWRAGAWKSADRRPAPVMDLSNTSGSVWRSLAESVAQAVALDPSGAVIRSTTRSYRNNARDHRQLHLLEGLAVLSQLEDAPDVKEYLSEPELLAIQARLALASQTLGGLVSDSNLPKAYIKQRTRTMEERGHNWELLRQRAEANGLYFEPFGLNGVATQALLWIARQDLGSGHSFDPQFLGISNPYGDSKLMEWNGYTETKIDESTGRAVELIPLAMYSLEHPKTPLLLVDFRHTQAPRRREMVRHATVDAISGVIGYSKWGNWPYFAGAWAFEFVRGRHGAPNDRSARIRAYSEVRQWLALDGAIDPKLKAELQHRLEALGVNPLGDTVLDETKFAQHQFAALMRYANDPHGLAMKIEHDREAEATRYAHNAAARTGLELAHWSTLGAYTHREGSAEPLAARIDTERRAARAATLRAVLGTDHMRSGDAAIGGDAGR